MKQEGKKKNNNTASGPDSTAKKPKDCKRNLQNSSDLQIKSSGKSSASKGILLLSYQYFATAIRTFLILLLNITNPYLSFLNLSMPLP